MKNTIIIIAVIQTIFFFMHEFDAFYRKEWKMFKFLSKLKPDTQYIIFLYAHIPLTFFIFYYMWTVVNFSNFVLWIVVNVFLIFHLLIHLIAVKWESNVFKSSHSFVFIAGAAVIGISNLLLINYY